MTLARSCPRLPSLFTGVVAVLLLAGAPVRAQDDPSKSPESLALDAKMDHARQSVEGGQYAEALQEYLEIFEKSRAMEDWAAVRLSFVLSEVAQMAPQHPPAKAALERLRSAARTAAQKEEVTFDDLHEYASINRYLGDHADSLELVKVYQEKGRSTDGTRHDLLDLVLSDLKMEAAEGAEKVQPLLPRLQAALDRESAILKSAQEDREFLEAKRMSQGGALFGLYLVLGKTADAEKEKVAVLGISTDPARKVDAWQTLVSEAEQANRPEVQAQLERERKEWEEKAGK